MTQREMLTKQGKSHENGSVDYKECKVWKMQSFENEKKGLDVDNHLEEKKRLPTL